MVELPPRKDCRGHRALVLWLIGTHHGFGRPFFDFVDPCETPQAGTVAPAAWRSTTGGPRRGQVRSHWPSRSMSSTGQRCTNNSNRNTESGDWRTWRRSCVWRIMGSARGRALRAARNRPDGFEDQGNDPARGQPPRGRRPFCVDRGAAVACRSRAVERSRRDARAERQFSHSRGRFGATPSASRQFDHCLVTMGSATRQPGTHWTHWASSSCAERVGSRSASS